MPDPAPLSKTRTGLEVLFAPAEFLALPSRDLTGTVCVVFDILRATSSMITALAHGAQAIVPVSEIAEALALRHAKPDMLLAGERHGVRILAAQTGSMDFDLGNSPREFTRAVVAGRTVAMTTTNGTRALRACAQSQVIFVGSFLALQALVDRITDLHPSQLLLVCAGTYEEASYEDTLAAGALCEAIWPLYQNRPIADSAAIARQIYRAAAHDLLGAMQHARNGRRLLGIPELRDDVAFCIQRDTLDVVACMTSEGIVRIDT